MVPAVALRTRLARRLARVAEQLRRVGALTTRFGRMVAAFALVAWFVAWRLHWVEFGAVVAGCAVVLVIASLFMLGRDRIAVAIALEPARVVAGQSAEGSIEATNDTGRRILPFRLEAPVGGAVVRADVPSLAIGSAHREEFEIPTTRRGVVAVGPVSSVRGDPLGLMRREVAWTRSVELFVHPRTVALGGIGSGWIRDLEGLSTNDISASDVELHTLREYEPGDDRRHVHWRTSVRVGKLMVRQYIDTRRWELAVVIATARHEYAGDDEFELAVSIAASLGARGLRDRQSVSCIAGPDEVPAIDASTFLDGLCRVEMSSSARSIADTVMESRGRLRAASVIVLVTGSRVDVHVLRLAAEQFPPGTRVVSIRARGRRVAVRAGGRHHRDRRRPPRRARAAAAIGGWIVSTVLAPARRNQVDRGDVFAVVAANLLALTGFRAAFSGTAFFVAGAGGTLLATAYWVWVSSLRINIWARVAGAVVAFGVVGPLATVRGEGASSFVPTPEHVGSVFSGSVHGWRTLVTTLPPVGNIGHVLAVPYVCGFLGASASMLLLRAPRVSFLAAVPPIALLGLGVLVGTDHPGSLYVEAGLLVAGLLLWAGVLFRRSQTVLGLVRRGGTRPRVLARGRGVGATVALLAVVTVGAGALGGHVPFVDGGRRYVLRDRVQSPFDPTQYPSPLAGFRKYRATGKQSTPLLKVDGVRVPTRLRIAVMDDYDGLVWRVADNGDLDAFRRAGSQLPGGGEGTVENLKVTIQGLQGPWLPTAGQPLGIDFAGPNATRLASNLRYNVAQATAAVPGGLQRGDSFTLRTTVDPKRPSVDGLEIAPQPAIAEPAIFTGFADKAGEIVKSASNAQDQAAAIAAAFRKGYYDDGPTDDTPPGHFLARINAFLRDPQPVGDAEQYAAAAAILLRARAIPARVVLGLTLEPNQAQYRYGDVEAWVEIPVAGQGWVAYDVTPAASRRPPPHPLPKQRVTGPQQPPQPPHSEVAANSGAVGSAETRTQNPTRTTKRKPTPGGRDLAYVFAAAGAVTLLLLLFAVPVLLILVTKRRRRVRRRRAETPALLISAGWDEVVDHLRDLGRPVPPDATRRELAITWMNDGLGDFASRVDASVFGPVEPTVDDARELWKESMLTCRRLSHSAGTVDRVRGALSVSSLRPEE